MKRVLVVGGLGFLGSEVVSALLESKLAVVTVLDLNWFSAPVPPSVTHLKKDAWNITPADLQDQDAVILLSGLANDQVVEADLARNFRDNAALPAYLGLLAKRAGVRKLVFSSTTSLYESNDAQIWTEDDAVKPQSPASVVKLQAEVALQSWSDPTFQVTIFRMGTICGWSSRPRLDLVINSMSRSAIQDGVIRVGGAEIWRSIVDVQDAGTLIAQTATGDAPGPGTFNLLENAYTLGELATAVQSEAARLGIPVRVELNPASVVRNFRASGAQLQKLLPGFAWKKPAQIAHEVLRELLKVPKEALENDKFSNFAVFSKGP